jgi:hypothetical protein
MPFTNTCPVGTPQSIKSEAVNVKKVISLSPVGRRCLKGKMEALGSPESLTSYKLLLRRWEGGGEDESKTSEL